MACRLRQLAPGLHLDEFSLQAMAFKRPMVRHNLLIAPGPVKKINTVTVG
jgi:hypothetical protein